MRVTEVSVAAAGVSPWIQHDVYQTPPAITLAGFISSGAVLTWQVLYTVDDLLAYRSVASISQTTTVITVLGDNGPSGRGNGHGLSAGDYVRIQGSGNASLDGEFVVATVPTATSYTLTSGVSQSATAAAGVQVSSARVFTHSVLTGQNGRLASNYNMPVKASRLNVTAFTSGVATLEVLQGGMSS